MSESTLQVQAEVQTPSVTWWQNHLSPPPTEAGPPRFRLRSKIYSSKRDQVRVPLPAELAGDDGPWAERLAAAVFGVLHRYTGKDRIALGSPLPAARDNGEPDNAVVVVAGIDPEASFSDLAAESRRALDEAYARGDAPIAEVVDVLGLTEIENRHPLFTVAVRVEGEHRPLPDLRHDVTVQLAPGAAEPHLLVDYNARLYEREVMERFAGHLLRFLTAGLAEGDGPIGRIDYLAPDERESLLRELAPGPEEAFDARPVHHLVTEQAARNPTLEAVIHGETTFTFDELNRRANRLAHALRRRGAEPGERVGLCISASADLLLGLLGILKSGATVVPIVPSFPPARNALTIEDAGLRWILTETGLADRLPQEGPALLRLDTMEEELAGESDENPEPLADLGDVAYILYTSGSTGIPKGVAMEHRSLANLVGWQRRRGEDPKGRRTLQRTSIGFDVSFQEIFSTWCFGGCLAVTPDEARDDVSQLPAYIERYGIHRTFLPPVSLQQLAAQAATQQCSLDSLKELFVAGEQLQITMPVIRLFREIECSLENQYGPTETHVVTAQRLEGPSTRWPALPPIGRPVAGSRVYLLDGLLQPVPVGVAGEIVVAGLPVARGYVREDSGSSSFLEDPFVDDGSEAEWRMYRTGDLGRYLPDGGIEFLGRRDHQIKIRGYRIELGEVEAILHQVPGVQQAAATVHEDETRGKQLVGYVVTEAPGLPTPQSIRKFMIERLPGHMVPAPSAMVYLDALPLTPTGKVDREALPAPEIRQRSADENLGASRNDRERQVAAIWAKVLGYATVGVNENFLDLGGHSLLGIQIVSQINDLYGIRFPLARLLQGITVAQTAAQILEMSEAALREDEEGAADGAEEPAYSAQTFTLPDGRQLASLHASETAYLYEDVFAHKTYDRAGITYPESGVVFDLGANVGLFTLYAQDRSPGLTVHAFEPAPPLYRLLEQNMNGRDGVHLHRLALGAEDGDRQLTFYPTLTGMTSLYADLREERSLLSRIVRNLAEENRDGSRELLPHLEEYVEGRLEAATFDVPVRRLSSVLAETGVETVDLLKIDVQKAELDVLRGIDDADWPRIRQLAVEVHDLDGRLRKVIDLLKERGYRVEAEQDSLHRGTVVHFVYAVAG